MSIDEQIIDEILQYDINREAAITTALLSGKIDKYKLLTSKEILLSDESRMIDQDKFTFFPLGKAFEEQIKIIED